MTEDQRTLLEEGCAQLESRAGLVWGPEFIEEFSAAIRSALAEIDALKSDANLVSLNAVNAALAAEVAALKAQRDEAFKHAINAALKAHDPLAEMWRELEAYQPMADRDGHGESWAKMCRERTKQSARDAGSAAHAVVVASQTRLAKLAAMDARDSTLFAGWASSNYVEGLKAVAEDAYSAIASIRKAKEVQR